ncbi:hypothetical protein [Bailinhaonella thermotolerans]|uniref:hypothetical protein n=1 Tax=Bailinhaonella thermotolerans TaxID=1070861 RepID=UPI0011C452EE|nr:hypothetical protein [Bailinhaonella thermotolerans]
MDGNDWVILGSLIGISGAVFAVIALLVLAPSTRGADRERPDRPDAARRAGPVWWGGPGSGEHGTATSDLVLNELRPSRAPRADVDWTALAETSEPGRGVGGASAGW